MPVVETIPLHETARERYLTYALSVITSRALPDVRDGLKPVQRRILYAMYTSLRLTPESRHRKSATIVGECFVAGTRVSTPGGWRPIEALEVGDAVHTQTGVQPVTACYVMPPQPLRRVTLRGGRALVCTPGQPFKVLRDDLTLGWADAADLRPGDAVVLRSTHPAGTPAAPGGFTLDADLAYLLGFFLADGWLDRDAASGRVRLVWACADRPIIERIRQVVSRALGHESAIEERRGMFWLRVNDSALSARFAEAFGLMDKYAATIRIPSAIWTAAPDVVAGFVSGFLDGDGTVHKTRRLIALTSIAEPFLRGVQTLLHGLGVASRLLPYRKTEQPAHHALEWALEVSGRSFVRLAGLLDLSAPRKRERLAACVPDRPRFTSEDADRIPFLGPVVMRAFQERHLGGGWYAAPDGRKVRSGLRYPGGAKLRYADGLADTLELSFPMLDTLGITRKMDALGMPIADTLREWQEHGVTFGEVVSVEAAPAETTFDIGVEGDHEFVAEGVVVHNCMGKYHPHGDTAIYDAMVRMAQPWSLRVPLVDGQGNFGSLDGDSPAAMRYTEARLTPFGAALLGEIKQDTVPFRPTYDGQLFEPVVLPATAPVLLVNGATGIAVGMATNIPPHNLGEAVDACLALLKNPAATIEALVKHLPAPDFPTGGRILNTPAELLRIYQTGEGAVDLRGEWTEEKGRVILTSVPYALDKSDLIEKIADHIRAGRVPQIVDIRDESTDDVRVVLELKKGASAGAAMAYLLKHTPLQTRFHVNLTCLVPTDNPEICAPQKVDLKTALQHFLDFRLDIVTRRLAHELRALETRIHILQGFAVIFAALDEAIRLIRASRDRPDANARLRHRFSVDEEQADAVLDIKLYRLARMEIDAILKELAEKEARAAEIRTLLADEAGRWAVVRSELRDVKKRFADARRSTVGGPDAAVSYAAEDYIISEDVYVIVTRDGWVKRQRSYTDLASIRVREGDRVLYALAASTRATLGFFTSAGRCYTLRVDSLPQTTGHGDPVQKYFDFADRETVVGVVSFDARTLPEGVPETAEGAQVLFEGDGAAPEAASVGPYVVAVSSDGLGVRFETAAFSDVSNKNGRVFMRLRDGIRVIGAEIAAGSENVCLASRDGRALIFPVGQIPVFRSAAKGVIAMRLAGDADAVLGMAVSDAARRGLDVETSRGRTETIRTTKFDVSNRGNRGATVISKGTLKAATADPIEIHLPGRALPGRG